MPSEYTGRVRSDRSQRAPATVLVAPPSASRKCAAGVVVAALLAIVCSACHSVGAKAWNLDQLHDAEGRHKYSAALESDIEYLLRHEIAGLLQSGSKLVAKDPSRVENPALRCLETLIELGEANPKDPRARALQVAWSTRLAASDPAALSRERAVLILGALGARLEVGRPAALPRRRSSRAPTTSPRGRPRSCAPCAPPSTPRR